MKRLYSFITSLPVMAFLFLAVAFSMAIATFTESSYGTPAAKAIIYNSWWFELLWALFALNLANNFFRFKLYQKEKLTLGIFHFSFLLILLGAAITRYISYEGVMHIREGEAVSDILSSDDYFSATYNGEKVEKKVLFSEITYKEFSTKFWVENNQFSVKSIGFIKDAVRQPIPSNTGESIIDFVFSSPSTQGMQSYIFKAGDIINSDGFSAVFNSPEKGVISFFNEGEELYFISELPIEEMAMGSQETIGFEPGDTIPAKNMFLYRYGDYQFLIRNFYEKATFTAAKSSNGATGENAVFVKIDDGIKEQIVPVFGHSGVLADPISITIGGNELQLAYGAKPKKVPFEIFLKDFQLEKYPGSESPSSYASEVVLIDKVANVKKDYRIFMNTTLTYKGFKFFQSSYDRDELGTVLSVNHDFWGTWITYIGYFLMMLGFVLSLLNPKSYFNSIVKRLKTETIKKASIVVVLVVSSFFSPAQGGLESTLPKIDVAVSEKFGEIWVQGHDGRIEPISTLSSEVVRKISRKSKLYGKSPNEVMLSFMVYPEIWKTLPIVKISNKNVAEALGVSGTFVSLDQLFDQQGNYKIADQVQEAYGKGPAFRNTLEKEYINVDERVNVCFMLFRGSLLSVFPSANNEIPWYVPGTSVTGLPNGDSLFVKSGIQMLNESVSDNNTEQALQVISALDKFQHKFGGELIPSERKKNLEILYNKINIFKRIFPFYLLFGILLLVVLFINIFRQKQISRFVKYPFYGLIIVGFIGHTAGLAVRWYISGHAPWSNGFESVVYVAWATMLAGLIFGRRYPLVVATAAFLSGIALFVAHLSWMNPEVTNLVPVLKSYWLAIHVAIITASYGFLGLSAFLGILTMVLIVLRNPKNGFKVNAFINQLTSVNELSATVGLYFLTTGTFLGGVWANESWGRYWGWDPKETWALITVVIYSFIVHMRLIPSLKGVFNYNMASILGFASVLMTYFGVNYYLSGLHSYGKGVADGVDPVVPTTLILLAILMIFAWVRNSHYEKSLPS